MKDINKTKYTYDKVNQILTDIENIDPAIGDIFESVGILLHDILEMCGESAKNDRKFFIKQRSDCRKTIKQLRKQIDNTDFMSIQY